VSNNKCLICGSSSFKELLHIDQFPILFGAVPLERKGKVKKYPLTVAVCNECSLTQQINPLPGSVLDDVYTADYYSCPAPSGNQVGMRVINEFYSFFGKNIPNNRKDAHAKNTRGKLLEIGCFDGYLLTRLRKDHWDVYGCDPAGQTSIAIENLGSDRIVNDFFSRDTYPSNHFEVIIFRHLLEHLYDLHSFLEAVSYALKEEGCIFIEVPNIYATFNFGGFGSFFHQHISHFSIETLQALLRQHNFIIEEYDETSVLHVKAKKGKDAGLANENKVLGDIESRKKEFLEKYHRIEKEIERIFAHPHNKKIAIFGASAVATTMVNMIDQEKRMKVSCIFDNDSSKHGKFIEGVDVPIASPEKVKTESFDVVIIGSYIFSDEIYAQLTELGVDKNKIISLTDHVFSINER